MFKSNLRNSTLFFQFLLFIIILSVFVLQIFSAPPNRESLLESENETKSLSKIWELESVNKSIAQFEQLSTQWEYFGDFSKSVNCLNEVAKLSQTTSDYQTAFRVLEKAIKLSNEHNLLEEKSISLSLYALISRQKGNEKDIDNSKKYSEEALQLVESINSPTAKGYALLSSGIHNFYHGNFEKSKEFFEKAEKVVQQTGDLELITQILLFNGFAAGRDGKALQGLNFVQAAMQRSEEGNYQRGKALSFFALGFLNMLLNEKQKALFYYQKAEELFPENFDLLEKAKLYNNLGVISEEYGNLELGELYREKAYSFNQKAKYLYGEIATLPSLARIKSLKGDFKGAKELLEKMIVLAYENKNKFHIAVAKEGIGDIELNQGNYDVAISNYQESLNTYNEIGVKLPRLENNLGKAFEKKGDFTAAKAFYTKALAVNTKTKDNLSASENLFNLARLSLLEGRIETAFDQINKSIEFTETLYSDVVNSKLKRSYFSNVYERYELLIHLLMQKFKQTSDKNFALQALQVSEKSRSRYLLENIRLAEAKVTKDAKPELIEREKEILYLLNKNADNLTELLSKDAEQSKIKNVEDEIFSLENELENVKAKLKQESPNYSAIKTPTNFELSYFQQYVLDNNSILLEFSLGERESYLWMIEKNEVSQFILPSRKLIEEHIEKIRETFEARQKFTQENIQDQNNKIIEFENTFKQESKALSIDLFSQISEKLIDKRIIVVPDGKLALLPINSLPLPNSDEPLILKNEIVYQPSASFLQILTNLQNSTKLPTKELIIFADPVFSDIDNRLLSRKEEKINPPSILGINLRDFRMFDANGRIQRLHATQDEANSIAEMVGFNKTTIANGFLANRERVLNPEIKDYRILHFATHGLIDLSRPEVSSLVLSQFDENGQKLEGFLRLQDIYSLELNTDLVVLSACQSGIGKEFRGEGLMSLSNAFLQAGAKTVVSSAWKVDDAATAELMRYFYENLVQKRLTPSESLRQAQLKMLNSSQYKSPFYWAAFTVNGEYRNSISTSQNYFYLKLGVFFMILGAGIYCLLRKRNLY